MGSTGDKESVLILCSGNLRERFEQWWAAQPIQILEVSRILEPNESPLNSLAAVLRVSGRYLEGMNLKEESDENLRTLFLSIIDAVDRGRAVQMYPDFNPSLTWLALGNLAVCPLVPLADLVCDDADQVRLAARAFYHLSTGVAPEMQIGRGAIYPAMGQIRDRRSWRESWIVRLQPTSSKTSITTLSSVQ